MSDKERVIKAILNAMDCDFGFACAVPGNWGIPESIVFKEESGLLRFINHLGASKVDVVKQGDMFYDLPVQPELLLHFNDVNLRLTIRRKDTIKDHYLSVVKERDELKRKVYGDPKKYHVGQDDCLHDVLRKQNVQATDANVIMLLKYNSNVLEYGQLIPGMELTIPAVWNKEQIKYTGTNYVPICIGCYQVENHEGLLEALHDHMGDTYFNLFIANHFDSQQPRSYPCVVRIARPERLSLLGIINPEDVVKEMLETSTGYFKLTYAYSEVL